MPDSKDLIPNTHHPGIPQRIDLSGCTFQGKQLSAQELEERERRSQAMEQHRKEINDTIIILRKHIKAKGNEPETRKVSVRGRHFSSNEIRREYGIMAKPYKTALENALHCIIHNGPIDIRGIAKIMEYTDFTQASKVFSGAISNLYNCLGSESEYGCGWITRERDGNRYHYRAVGPERSVEVMYAKYLEIMRRYWQDKRAKTETADTPGEKPVIKKMVEQYLEKTMGLKVEVDGKIDINFNFNFKVREVE